MKSNAYSSPNSEDGWHPLQGGMTNTVFHKEGMVRRPLRDSSPTVHQLLVWLQTHGFEKVPAFIQATENEEILSYIQGDVIFRPWPDVIQEERWMSELAHWVRDFQQVTSGFCLSDGARFIWGPAVPEPGMVISHGDLGLWNCIHQSGSLKGVIDWDMARYGHKWDDLAQLAWEAVPLRDTVESAFGHVVDDRILVQRLTRLCDEFGECSPQALIQHLLEYIRRISDEIRVLAQQGREPFVSYVARDFISDYQKDSQFIQEKWLNHPFLNTVTG